MVTIRKAHYQNSFWPYSREVLVVGVCSTKSVKNIHEEFCGLGFFIRGKTPSGKCAHSGANHTNSTLIAFLAGKDLPPTLTLF